MNHTSKIELNLPSPLVECCWPTLVRANFSSRNLNLMVKRDDLIHPYISGNKWRKLKLNIEKARQLGKKGIMSFGGAYSNHLLALACVGNMMDFPTIGFVRGEELNSESNKNLKQCSEWNMQLKFMPREWYSLRNDWEFLSEIKDEHRDFYLVPEGGANLLGALGCQDIITELDHDFNHLWLASGTGTTTLGLSMSLSPDQKLFSVPVLKGFDAKAEYLKMHTSFFMDTEFALECAARVEWISNAHFGGYGKSTQGLEDFIRMVGTESSLQLDEVYTAKAFHALIDYYRENSDLIDLNIVFLHTGGLHNKKGQSKD